MTAWDYGLGRSAVHGHASEPPRSHPPAPPARSVPTRLLARHVDQRDPAAGGVVRGLVDAPLVPQIDRRPAVAKLDEPAELGAGRLRRVVGRPHTPVLGLVRLDDRTRCPAAVAVARMVLDLSAWIDAVRYEPKLECSQIILVSVRSSVSRRKWLVMEARSTCTSRFNGPLYSTV